MRLVVQKMRSDVQHMCAVVQKVPVIVQLTHKAALQNLVVVHQQPVIVQQKRVADELLMFVVVNYSTADK